METYRWRKTQPRRIQERVCEAGRTANAKFPRLERACHGEEQK